MTDLIDDIRTWLSVAKGDTPGHQFHGNQWTGGEGRTDVSPSQKAEAHRVAALVYQRAQRNEPEITREIQESCQQFGGTRDRSEFQGVSTALKGQSSIERKLLLDSHEYLETPKGAVDTAAENLSDALRYTIKFPTDKFSDGVKGVLGDFKTEGFETLKIKNFFDNNPGNSYRGINAVFRDTTTNQKFEVQFHTPESSSTIDKAHPIYEQARLLSPSSPGYSTAQQQMSSIWSSVPIPPGVESIGLATAKREL